MKIHRLACAFIACLALSAGAQTPALIGYQGRIVNGTNLVNGAVGLSLSLYDASSGGNLLYADSNTVVVSDGLYQTYIGDQTVAGSLQTALTNASVWLQVTVNGVALTPRERITSVAYARAVQGLYIGDDNRVALNPEAGSNVAGAAYGTVGGGQENVIAEYANHSVIAGGFRNVISNSTYYAAIGGGSQNHIGPGSDVTAIGGGLLNEIGESSGSSTVGGGFQNRVGAYAVGTTIAGGYQNTIESNAFAAMLGGGIGNTIQAGSDSAALLGGSMNTAAGSFSFLGAGSGNVLSSRYGFLGAGLSNQVSGTGSVIVAGQYNVAGGCGSFIGSGSMNAIAANASSNSTIVGGERNTISEYNQHCFIGGGLSNQVQSYSRYSAVVGGWQNTIAGGYGIFIGGGLGNEIGPNGYNCGIVGGKSNKILSGADNCSIVAGEFSVINNAATDCVIVGGYQNTIASYVLHGFIGSGNYNSVNRSYGVIAGGTLNKIEGPGGIIPGGSHNTAGEESLAAGNYAQATNRGCFVWGDNHNVDVGSTVDNQFTVRATGGARFITGINGSGSITSGVQVAAGSGTWTSLSDRNAKENFEPVDSRDLLEKLLALPVVTWNYKTQDDGIRHMGPTAQDFRAAFGLGESDTGITTVDADGVALAAIQALNRKLEAENAALRARLEAIERRLNAQP